MSIGRAHPLTGFVLAAAVALCVLAGSPRAATGPSSGGAGTVRAASATSITISISGRPPVRCRVSGSLSPVVARLTVGEAVDVLCRGGALALLMVNGTTYTATPAPAGAGSSITLAGALSGSVSITAVTCNTPVAASQRKFFFDMIGTAGASPVVFSGTVNGYGSPRSYSVAAAYGHLILRDGAHIYAGITTGTVAVGSGPSSGTVRVSLTNHPAESALGTGTVRISGHFACTATTTA